MIIRDGVWNGRRTEYTTAAAVAAKECEHVILVC